MKEQYTIGNITKMVEGASTDYEKTNTDLKRKYLIWCIDSFNKIASKVSVSKGTFGTGYPFYALDSNLQGKLPIISEQIRYNRQLIKDGEPYQNSIWECLKCLQENYAQMPDLKIVCKPCPNVPSLLKPRKIINRLPDMDMWLVCEDGMIEHAQAELNLLFKQFNMRTSDVDPLLSIQDIINISKQLKKGVMPEIYLPIDSHVIEYSQLKKLICEVPNELTKSKKEGNSPYLPIHPKSLRKKWQYDDEAYNYIWDFLLAFTDFNFEKELKCSLEESRARVSLMFSNYQLFEILLNSASQSSFRRLQSPELEEYFYKRIDNWRKLTSAKREDRLGSIDEEAEKDVLVH